MWFKKLPVFLLCLVPIAWLIFQVMSGRAGPDFGKELVLFTGIWALRFLIATLAITSIRRLTGFTVVIRYRRMVGLYVWFYASVHLLAILTYMLGWSWYIFVEEFVERPYMALGIIAWVLLVPLGLTSNLWMIKKLGRYWKLLHKLIYVIAILACAHFIWLIRSDYWEALFYSSLVALLLLNRFISFVVPRLRAYIPRVVSRWVEAD
ncbi:MAG: sulfoxide reductase heme-binding subunit YedZ [Spongiibacteraceae bacterium]|nr:sulfoxide reductase heme-binding subunit YedZ [Spongiibacteraceae bacterium]